MGLKFRNPKFNILSRIWFFIVFYKTITLWSWEVDTTILEQIKITEYDDYIYASIFQETKTTYTKLVLELGTLNKFHVKTSVGSLLCIKFVSFIWNSSTVKVFSLLHLNITLNCWVISKTINTGENAPWVPLVYDWAVLLNLLVLILILSLSHFIYWYT